MPDVGYSDKAIRALGDPQPPKRKIVFKVQTVPGLWIAVHAGGARSWFLRYSIGGDRKKMVLGRYPEMTLRKAKASAEAKTSPPRSSASSQQAGPPAVPKC